MKQHNKRYIEAFNHVLKMKHDIIKFQNETGNRISTDDAIMTGVMLGRKLKFSKPVLHKLIAESNDQLRDNYTN